MKNSQILLKKTLAFLTSIFLGALFSLFFYVNSFASPLINSEDTSLLLSAMEGNPDSQSSLAAKYTNNPENEFYWYKQAARQGAASAQFSLAYHYLQGVGTDIDKHAAVSWWKQAAEQGHTHSQYNLGRAFHEGIGTDQNVAKAIHWFQLAAKKGDKRSIKALELVSSEPTQSKKAEKEDENKKDKTETSMKLPVYFSPETTSFKIVSLTAEQVKSSKILSRKGDWNEIQCKQSLAVWSYKSFVKINDDKTVSFTGDNVRARKEPSIQKGNIILEIKKGSQFPLLQQNEKWVQIELSEFSGWVNKEQSTSPASETKKAVATKIERAKFSPIHSYTFKNTTNDNDWLFNSGGESYTLVLGTSSNDNDLKQTLSSLKPVLKDEMKVLSSKRQKIEWKHVLIGNFSSIEQAKAFLDKKKLQPLGIARIDQIQQQRCSAWKKIIPVPKLLKKYCLASS